MVNLAYDALDVHVIRGRAAETAVARGGAAGTDFATLTEEVAALAGVLRAFGVVATTPVLVALPDEYDELVAVLATLRLRAVPVLAERVHADVVDAPGHHPSAAALAVRHRPHVVITASVWPGHVHRPAAVLYRGPEPTDPEVEVAWDVAMKAGRTDPAPAERETSGTPVEEATAYVVGDRAVLLGEVPEVGTQIGRRLGALLGGRLVTLT